MSGKEMLEILEKKDERGETILDRIFFCLKSRISGHPEIPENRDINLLRSMTEAKE